MPANTKAPPHTKPKRSLWRRLLRGLGWTLLVLLILHWPLIIFGGPIVARMAARKQHLDVNLELSGTIWTNLTISNLRATPLGTGVTPVESIKIDKLSANYSLWRLAQRGVGEFLSSFEMHKVDLAFIALPSKTEEEKEVKKSVIETLRTILTKPAAYSDRVVIDDFSISVRSPDSETVVRGIDALFDPRVTGHLRIERMQIPGLPLWENLSAETSYQNRNLIQRGLRLGPDIVIDEMRFDASRRAEGRGEIGIAAHLFGGEFSLTLTGQEKDEEGEHLANTYDTRLKVAAAGIRVRELAEYFGVKGVPLERLELLAVDFTGDPEKPRTWNGNLRAAIVNLTAGTFVVPRVELASEFKQGTATAKGGVILGRNSVQLDSQIALPEQIGGWLASAIDAKARIDVPDLTGLVAGFLPEAKASGTVGLEATIGFHERKATVQARLQTRDVVFDQISMPMANGDIALSTTLSPEGEFRPATLDSKIDLTTGAVTVNTFSIDGVRVVFEAANGDAVLRQLTVNRGSNAISATGRARLPADPKQFAQSAGDVQFTIQAPKLGEFGVVVGGTALDGKIEAQSRVQFAEGKPNGDLQLNGNVTLGEFKVPEIGATVRFRGDAVQLDQFTVALNDVDRIVAKGRLATAQPQPYEGSLTIGIRDLAVLQPLLTIFGVKDAVKGALDVGWAGKGAVTTKINEGDASITLKAAKYGAVELNEFQLGGRYLSESANAELHAVSGPTQFRTQIVWAEQRVGLRDIELRQGEQVALTGEISYGLAGMKEPMFDPLKQPLAVSLHANQLDIEKLLTGLVKPVSASGRLTMHLAAQGTPLRPEVELKIEGRALKAKAAAQFDAAEVDVALNYVPGSLTLDASARQPLVQPLVIKARVPVDVEKIATDKKLDPALPLDVTVKMPATSLAVLPKLVPAVRRINGTAALDVQVGGTVEKPQLGGAVTIALQEARLTSEAVPAIGKFDARLVFAKDTLTFERFGGIIGGGTFGLSGTIGIADFKDPTFNLQAKADDVLGMRNDSITVRADADVKVGGSLKAGTVSGTVFVTQSRFYKEIDILPIGLPGKPRPAPKSAPSTPNISLPPPLDTWKFDLAIKTRENDPFLVRGNLANGRVALNLALGGTGAKPWAEGEVLIEQFTGSLPFSTITIENGHVYFTQNAPFQPTLEIHAQSKVRDYTVGAYIFGKATEPQLLLTSEPPLPHADIVSLLATGTTVGELSGNADVLASRAAMLAITSLWKKIFKPKGGAAPPPPNKNDPGFADRFQLDLGAVDQKTGAREATARFKVNDQTYILGEFDTQGRYTGSLKYLLRFR